MVREKSPHIYQLKISLMGSDPLIWRRVQLRGDASLNRLHQVLQAAMGWGNCHMYKLQIGERKFSEPLPDLDFEDDSAFSLEELVSKPKEKFLYEYDFGDSWFHQIVVEKVLDPAADQQYPVCIAGARNCPPEDCGGIGGYEMLLEAIDDPDDPEHDQMTEWIGGGYDSEAFNLAEINSRLKKFWPKVRART